jgi:hypothetical protein
MRDARKLVLGMLALVAAMALTACGSGSGTTGETAEIVSGDFTPVADTPAGYSEVSGEADIQRPENGGTVVSLRVTGLEPQTDYIAHLHTGGCDQADPGGPHFQFKKGGSEEPPNEIHLQFTSDAAGEGKARVSTDREVPVGEAGSVVIHNAEEESHHEMVALVHEGEDHGGGGEGHPHSEKIACAELEGAAAGNGEATAGESGGEVPTIVVRDGEPVGGVQTLEFSAGEEVRFRVSSDAAEEIHVHGYDIAKEVPAGGTIEFDFPAELEGIYEAELEELGVQIAELRINP